MCLSSIGGVNCGACFSGVDVDGQAHCGSKFLHRSGTVESLNERHVGTILGAYSI